MSLRSWFYLGWLLGAMCLIALVILRFRLVHVLTTRYSALYLELGSPAFFVFWLPVGQRDVISALRSMPSATLAAPDRLVVQAIWAIRIAGRLISFGLVFIAILRVLFP